MSSPNHSIVLRPATNEDESFLLEVYKSCRGEDLRELGWGEDRINEFLDLQYGAQQRFYEGEYKDADDQIVLVKGRRAGRIMVARRDQEIRCVDIALLPVHRSEGIGTFLIRQLQDQAKRGHKPLRLQIIRFSRAVNLFERLGFVRTSETGTHFQMEWHAIQNRAR